MYKRQVTSVIQDADGLKLAIDEMIKRLDGLDFDVIAGAESRDVYKRQAELRSTQNRSLISSIASVFPFSDR